MFTVPYRVYKPQQSGYVLLDATFSSKEPTLAEIKEVVVPLLGDAEMEHVYVLLDGKPTDMFVDELGVVKHLPRNDEATAIYRASWMQWHLESDPETLPAIHGVAVVFEKPIWY